VWIIERKLRMIKKRTHSDRIKAGLAKAKLVEEFLRESNAIEGIYDEDSLKQAKIAWKYLMSQKALTIDVVLKTYKILMLHQPLQPHHRGYFRDCEVMVGGRYGASHYEVPSLIWNWVFETMRVHPKVDAKQLHIQFEKIHPFVDGNGRVGRMLMNWTRIKRNKEPLLIVHKGPEQMEYYKWFKD